MKTVVTAISIVFAYQRIIKVFFKFTVRINTFCISLFIFFSILGNSYGQFHYWQIVQFYGPLKYVNLLTPNKGLIIGSEVYYKSTDGGRSWGFPQIAVTPLLGNDGKFFFIDSLYGWCAGDQTSIIRTINGGNSWSQYLVWWVTVSDIFFINRNIGWAISNEGNCPYSTLYKTFDGGQNWAPQNVSGYENKPKYSIFMNDQNTGWIGLDSGKAANTLDGGNTWDIVNFNSTKRVSLIFFKDQNHGWICLNPDQILRTTNAGMNWSLSSLGTNYINTTQIYFFDTLNGIISLDNQILLLTSNGGLNWNARNPNVSGTNNSFCFKDRNNGWIVSDGGQINQTTNGGNNWFAENNQIGENYKGVFFNDNNTGWIVTDHGTIIKTNNGGINWSINYFDGSMQMSTVYFANTMTGWISGTGGKILKTINGGNNWSYVQVTGLPSNAMCFTDIQNGWLAGNSGAVFYTTTSGNNWTAVTVPTNKNLYSVSFTDANTGYVCGDSGKVYKTTNKGNSWVSVSPASFDSYKSIKFYNSLTGLVTGNHSSYSPPYFYLGVRNIYRTTNGGINWTLTYGDSSGNTTSAFNSIWINSQGYTSAVGTLSKVICSWDEGATWSWNLSPNLSSLSYNGVFVLNDQHGWAVGNSGAIVVSSIPPIGIKNLSSNISSEFKLYQNYPNPFNPSTIIKFNMPKSGHVKLIIYDLLGREIATLVNDQLKPGSYETEWPAKGGGSNYASGIYFYSLQTESFTQTKKLVLLK